jgi:hypothetical protein
MPKPRRLSHTPKPIEQLDFKLALAALRSIMNHGGLICEDCADYGFNHRECWASYNSWNIAATTLERIGEFQRGKYLESD